MNEIELQHEEAAEEIAAMLMAEWKAGANPMPITKIAQIIADNDPYADELEEEEENEDDGIHSNDPPDMWSALWGITSIVCLISISDKNSWWLTCIQIILALLLVWVRITWYRRDTAESKTTVEEPEHKEINESGVKKE